MGIGRDIAQGSIAVSRHSFLESRLLKLLATINRNTTVLPSFAGVDGGEWNLKLTTWGKHEIKKNRATEWEQTASPTADLLKFDWLYRDNWRYEHEGRSGTNGVYSVKCEILFLDFSHFY